MSRTKSYNIVLPSTQALAEASPAHLIVYQDEIKQYLKVLKNKLTEVEDHIHEEWSKSENEVRKLSGKQSGRIEIESLEQPDGSVIRVVSDATKKVTWLQPPLRAIFGSLPLAQAEKYIDVEFTVKEASYEKLKAELPAWEAEHGVSGLVAKLEESRVVKYGDAKISLEKKGA